MVPRNLNAVNCVFDVFGDDIRLVGGPVRDILINVEPSDFDFCTPLLPPVIIDRLKAAGYNAVDLSNGHGTITSKIEGETIEITTLRIDAETDGRHATVEFVTDWEADAARRDFTFNAMSMDRYGIVYDYFCGEADLKDGHVMFVGSPKDRIQEDYLRIIRYFRFWQRFGIQRRLETDTAIMANLNGLRQVSVERIWSEFKKLKYDKRLTLTLSYMKELGVLETVYNL